MNVCTYVCMYRWSNLRYGLLAEFRWNQVFCHQCADICRICKHGYHTYIYKYIHTSRVDPVWFYEQVVHVGETSAVLKVGDQVAVHVDYERRAFVAPNHTMTHVLNYALRKVLLNSKTNGSRPSSYFQTNLRPIYNNTYIHMYGF